MESTGSSLFIPAGLKQSIHEFGEEGIEWLRRLPGRVAELEREWGLCVGPAFDHGGCVSWVAPVTLEGGGEAVLKIGIPHDEARYEADALRFMNGQGAARLLRASDDGFSLLLERCVPGNDLWSLDEAAGDAVAAGILPRLWREPPPEAPFLTLADLVEEWIEDLPQLAAFGGVSIEEAASVLERGRELAASASQRVFLHGDFNPGNALASQREPWLVIDPKPLVGDPAYDLAQWLINRYDAAVRTGDPVSALRGKIDRFASCIGLDPARIAEWAYVKAIGWEWGPEATRVFQKIAKA
ncbi:MAG: aminoglycoside phosphotransferase family protein [Armatimonadetes bacterium]|nr:aminoglycoside phosphotransferase family protein [Armatimonadota bacterium]